VKPWLTVLLRAGSTISLDPDHPTAIGIPSTWEISERVAKLQNPKAVLVGTPFLQTDSNKTPFAFNTAVPVLHLIYRALQGTFDNINFELILHSIEQLLPLAAMNFGATSSGQFHPAIGAFVEMQRRYDFLNDWSLLRATRDSLISAIRSEICNRSSPLPNELPLNHFVAALADKFRLAIFTLNYDDVVDRTPIPWFDGFSRTNETSGSGPHSETSSFDARAFDGWKDVPEAVLVHLHGSVRFAPSLHSSGLVKYRNANEASQAITATSESDKTEGGQIVSADPIISGLNKAARLTLNPEPYGYYYRALIDSLLLNERLLVIGYGARDEHVNTWLTQYANRHREQRRVAWIGKLDGKMVGARTPEKDLITLLSNHRFTDALHYARSDESNPLINCGALRLGASGFPIAADVQSEIISFLSG
jgi:SIR2-like protein